jgi:hypothetical protein
MEKFLKNYTQGQNRGLMFAIIDSSYKNCLGGEKLPGFPF